MSSTAAGSVRRQQSALAGPKPPCSIHPSAIISDKAIIVGTYPVTIGENVVLHPFAKIVSTTGPVSIGKNCIIAERTSVGLTDPSGSLVGKTVELQDSVSIETGAVVQAACIGTGSTVEVNANLGPQVVVGKFCKISASSHVLSETLPDFTIVFGDNARRIDATTKTRQDVRDLKLKGQLLHIDTLKRLIPSNTMKWQS